MQRPDQGGEQHGEKHFKLAKYNGNVKSDQQSRLLGNKSKLIIQISFCDHSVLKAAHIMGEPLLTELSMCWNLFFQSAVFTNLIWHQADQDHPWLWKLGGLPITCREQKAIFEANQDLSGVSFRIIIISHNWSLGGGAVASKEVVLLHTCLTRLGWHAQKPNYRI